ncbi:MAG: SMP-30/gluconolactonase/LRE family protein [Actinomycetota bacterium]
MVDANRFSVLVEGLDHPEGVCVDASGRLFAGGEAGQVYRIDVDEPNVAQVASTGGFMLGLCADAGGILYCCDVGRRQMLKVDPESGSVEVYSSGTNDRKMVNPNWPAFDETGNLYVTDSGTWKGDDGCIFRIDAAGTTSVWSEASTNFPNGSCLSVDGKSLLVLESCTPGLVRIPIQQDGSAGEREVIAELPGSVPDGIALDVNGNAYVCCYRPDRIYRVSAVGEVEIVAEDAEGTLLSAPTNGVFIGDDRRRFVTGNLGRWHLSVCDWGVEGLALRYPKI